MSASSSLSAGHVIAGRYEILATLGKGGMGVVYKAHDRVLNETVAIKVLRAEVAESPDMAQRFLGEIKLARTVTHRNVCRIHEYGEDGGLRYISMAFVDGVDLKQVLRERGPLPPDQAFEVAIAVAEGLQAIHDEGIIHRDLKTPNLMIDGRNIVRLMDFGIAKQWTEGSTAGLTAVGMIVGTPEYMSPEQVMGKKLDFRSDIYALGVVIYEIFTGHTPFEAETPVGLLMKHLQEPVPLDGPAAAMLPPALVPVLARALAKDRDGRFASATELADALREARLQTLPAASRPLTRGSARQVGESWGQPVTFRPEPTAVPAAATTARVRPLPVPPAPVPTTANARALTVPGATVPLPGAAIPDPEGAIATRRHTGLAYALVGLLAAAAAAVAVVLVMRQGATRTALPASASPPAAAAAPARPPEPLATGAPPRVAQASPLPGTGAAPALPTPAPARPGAAVSKEAAAEVAGLLAEAESAFAAQQYSAALAFYDQALKLQPGNERARVGRELCASALSRAPAAPAVPARAFVSGRTEHLGSAASSGPAGFETSVGVDARRVDATAAAPGKILFEVQPEAVKPGDQYTIKVFLLNEGAAPLPVSQMVIDSTVDGRRAGGAVPPLTRSVAPHQKALVFSLTDYWRAETTSWSMAVALQTGRGDSYRNALDWR